jgi:hypothetical protein
MTVIPGFGYAGYVDQAVDNFNDKLQILRHRAETQAKEAAEKAEDNQQNKYTNVFSKGVEPWARDSQQSLNVLL